MISHGTHKAEVLSSTHIRVGDLDVPFETSNMVGATISILSSFGGQLIFLEQVTPAMMDEVTIRNELRPKFVMPASGVITSVFGPRRDPVYGGDEFHDGIDISGQEGEPIYAIDEGGVCRIDQDHIYGTYVEIDHGNGMKSIYGHLSEVKIELGPIDKGQLLGLMGNTGKSSGPHLHLGLYYHGKYLNPRVFYGKPLMMLGNSVTALEESLV